MPHVPYGFWSPKITLGACALAAGLYKIVTSATVTGALTDLLERALHAT
ncbi:DUF4244 domain-containing protein [Kitasatospora aureofaciens]|nr:DUF4244 domain-containing protein [Kitasatospora aureofaciens]